MPEFGNAILDTKLYDAVVKESAIAVRRAVIRVISAERERQHFPINEFAAAGEFNRSTLTRYLYEDTDLPVTALYRIAAVLGLTACEILRRAEALIADE